MATEPIPTHRQCTKCLEVKPLAAFHSQKLGRYGRRSTCRECRSASGGVDVYLAHGPRPEDDGHSWRPVLGWEGYYAASDDGRIKSVDRLVTLPDGRQRLQLGRMLRSYIAQNGYPYVRLSRNGITSLRTVHSLVAEAFLGPRPEGHDVAHADGDRTNAAAENLRWATRVENSSDKLRHGTDNRGEKHPLARLTDDQVRIIRTELAVGAKEMARRFNVSHWQVYQIRSGRSRTLPTNKRATVRRDVVYIPAKLRKEVERRHPPHCHYCGTAEAPMHIDHYIPLALGGLTEADNLVIACERCNSSKGSRMPSEWKRPLRNTT